MPLLRTRGRLDRRARRIGVHAGREQRAGDIVQPPHTHINHQRHPRGNERGPVRLAAAGAVSGDEHHALRVIAMRHRNADRRGRRNPGGDAVDHVHFDTRCMQRLLFFAATAEHERIAAFQTRDAAPGLQVF